MISIEIWITTAGGYPYPMKCIESILAGIDRLPDGVRLMIRDNPASKKDETFKYLVKIAKRFGPEKVLLFSPDWAGEHGYNLDFLLTKSTAEWAIAIDSDIEFVNPRWLDEIKFFIFHNPSMEVAVEMATLNKPNDLNILPDNRKVPRIWLPRATSYFMLFKPAWIREQGVSFGRNDFEVKPIFQDVFPYPCPSFLGDEPLQRWTCDHGWQLLWAGLNCNETKPYTCVQIPPEIRDTYVHHNHKICGFMLSQGDKPNSPTNRAHWGQDIPQLIPK